MQVFCFGAVKSGVDATVLNFHKYKIRDYFKKTANDGVTTASYMQMYLTNIDVLGLKNTNNV